MPLVVSLAGFAAGTCVWGEKFCPIAQSEFLSTSYGSVVRPLSKTPKYRLAVSRHGQNDVFAITPLGGSKTGVFAQKPDTRRRMAAGMYTQNYYQEGTKQARGSHPNELTKYQLDFKQSAVVTVWYKPSKDATPCDTPDAST